MGGIVNAIPLPSSETEAAQNYVNGIPNTVVVLEPGRQYYYRNIINKDNVYPSIYIRGYNGTPRPVIDRDTGELVAVLTVPTSWSMDHPGVPVSIIPDNNDVGIMSDDPNYDIVIAGFFIQNTGRGYTCPSINIIDSDTGMENGEATLTVLDGRIVSVNLSNNGSGFKRIPKVMIMDRDESCTKPILIGGGYGATMYPIMNVLPKTEAKPDPVVTMAVYCPGKNARNLVSSLQAPEELVLEASREFMTGVIARPVETTVETTVALAPAATASVPVTPTNEPTPTPTPAATTPSPTPDPSPSPAPSPTPSPAPSPTPSPAPSPTPSPSPSPSPGGYY